MTAHELEAVRLLFAVLSVFGVAAFLTWLLIRIPVDSKWMEGLECKECNNLYSQEGFNPSVYTCPDCGNKTTYCSFRRVGGVYETKPR